MTGSKFIIANWKMNPPTAREAKDLFRAVSRQIKKDKKASVVICPPAIFLYPLALLAEKSNIELGAQDVFWGKFGAYTGSVSAPMLRYAGARFVIVGHSEQRARGETNEIVNKKLRAVLAADLRPILCIGESVRDSHGQYLSLIREQLGAGLGKLSASAANQLIIAYEPVWAIGRKSEEADTPEGFLEQAIFIRKVLGGIVGKKNALSIPILYGGSVERSNAHDFLSIRQAAGLLVGHASLDPRHFIDIVQATKLR